MSILTWEIEQFKLTELVARCKQEKVSVHSALTAAFFNAQYEIEGSFQNYLRRGIIPVNVRNLMIKPVGEEMGYYVSAFAINVEKISEIPFWELVHKINNDIKDKLRDNRFFGLSNLHPSLLDAIHFVQQGELDDKLARFVSRILGWGQLTAGLEISNIGKLNFPNIYAPYRLAAIFGPIIYEPRVEKFIGIATVAEKMTFSCTYRDTIISTETVKKIRDRMLECLENNV